jgi:hypothetical protein
MPNEYSDLIAQDKTNDLRQSVYVGARQQPDVEAKLQALSQRTGVPLDAVRLKQPEVELHDRLQSFDYEKAIKESPKLSAWMADPKNSGVAHDDFDNLSAMERTLNFGANVGRELAAAPVQMSSNLWGIGRAVGDVLPDVVGDHISEFAAKYQKGAAADAKRIRGAQAGAGFVEKSIYSGVGSLGQNLLMLPMTLASGGAAPMLYGMTASTGGEAYGQARDKGVNVPQALGFAASQATVEYATEMIPAIKLIRDVGLKTGFGKMLRNQMLAEIPSEQAATVLQDLNEWATLNQDKPFSEYLKERPSAAAQTLIATMVSAGGQVSVTQGLSRVMGGDVQAQNEAFFKTLAEGSTNSKLRERLPDRFKELVAKYTEDGPVQNVFVPADKFSEYFQSVGIDPIAAADEAGATNFKEALATGGDVVIPMADFATHIAPTDHLQGLMQDLRLRQDEMTSREAKLAEANRDETDKALAEEIKKLNEMAGQDAGLDTAIQRIVSDVEGQLSSRYDTNTARQMATVMRGMAILATRANPTADPVQAAQALWSKYGLNIRANPLPDVLTKAPDFDAAIDPLLDRLRKGDLPKQQEMFGKSLVEWLREQGGVKDQGGELAARDAVLWDRSERKGGERRLVSENGLDFDAARELAAQFGYDVGATEADFIDALDREIGGSPVFAAGQGDDSLRRIADTLDGLGKVLSEIGVDLSAMDNAAVKQLLRGGDTEFEQPFDGGEVAKTSLADGVTEIEVDGVMRPALNSNGKPIHWSEEGVRNFWRWFGDSVMTVSGKAGDVPLVVYHGTYKNFDTFKDDTAIMITPSPKYADSFTMTGVATGGNIMPLYARIEKPHYTEDQNDAEGLPYWMTGEELRAGDFDGLIYSKKGNILKGASGWGDDIPQYAVFSPDQLKSTTGNSGAFGKDTGNILFQSAFHGSPYRFSKFSLEHMGKGEGAQAYGWGLYFAGSKDVAEYYRKTLGANQYSYDGKALEDGTPEATAAEFLFGTQGDVEIAIEDIDSTGLMSHTKQAVKKAIRQLDYAKIKQGGQLYEVNIPEDDTMLLWDKPLSEQPESVQKALGINAEAASRYNEITERMNALSWEKGGLDSPEWNALLKEAKALRTENGFHKSGEDLYDELKKSQGSDEATSKYLNSLGISGIKYLDGTSRNAGDGSYNYVIFDDAAIDILNTYYQDKRGSIQFGSDRKFQINLFEKADLSTFLHESGHFYLEVLGDLADDQNASQEVKDDYARILQFLGVQNRSEIQTEHHEKFARANEAYLMEGKAPAPELRGVFQRFRSWLKVIYGQLTKLNVELSDEVRGVFDRIYATDAEIQQASQQAKIEHLFLDAATAGMTEAEFQAYSDTVANATTEAKEELQTKLMRVEKLKRERWWRDERNAMAEAVAAEYDALPAAKTFDALSAGDSELKLNRKALTERYGQDILKRLPRGYGDGKGAVYTDDGADLDSVAEVQGYQSADDMISALVNLPNRKRYIAAESDRRMMEKHGDLLNDVALADEAMLALHNEKREQVLRIELRQMRKMWKAAEPALKLERAKQNQERRDAVDVARMPAPEQLRQIAAGIIGQKQVRDINPNAYLLAERKAAKAAFEAMAKRDLQTATVEKQKELLNHYLYREAVAAKKDADSIVKYLKGFESDKTRGKLGKAGDQYLAQIDGFLERYELKTQTNRTLSRRDSLSAWLAEQEAQGNAVNVPESVIDDSKKVNYRTVPIDELRAVRDAVKNIAHLANLKTKLVRKGKLVEFQTVVDELLGSVDAASFNSTGDFGKTNTKADGILTKAAGAWRKFDAAHMKVEQVVEWLDGGKIDGPWARYFFDLADDAQTQEYDLHRMVTTQIQKLAEHLDKKTLFDRTTVSLAGFNQPMTRYDLISIAMNMGNAQNMQRLMDGYGWSQADIQRVRDSLSKSDWQFVQGTWDAIDQLWPHMAALEKRASGLEPERVVPVEFEAHGETFRGGYFPLVYDPRRSNAGEKQADADESVQNFVAQGYGRAATNRGATKKRAEQFSAPVLLDYEHVITAHMAKVIKDISHREAIIGLNKILTQGQIKEALIDKLGEAQYTEFRKWMQVLVNDRSDSLTEATGAAKWMMKFRTNTAIVTMGFKISTMMSQIAGIGPTLDLVGARNFGNALTQFAKAPAETWQMVTEKSGEMRNRSNTLERDVRDALLRMRGEGGLLADVRRHAFILTAMADRAVAAPTWLAGYQQALQQGRDEETAIRAGDRAVRLSQGAGGSKDLAAVQRNSELMRLLTMYYTPFSVLYARLRDVGHQTATEGIGYLPAAAARLIALVIIPAVLGDILAGRGPDDDEDEAWWAIRKILLYPVATLPVIRDFAGYMEAGIIAASGEGQMKFPPSYKLSPIVGAIDKSIRTVGNVVAGNDNKTGSEIAWDAFEASGYWLGLPTAQARISGEYITDLISGNADPENAPQLLHDALFRREKK